MVPSTVRSADWRLLQPGQVGKPNDHQGYGVGREPASVSPHNDAIRNVFLWIGGETGWDAEVRAAAGVEAGDISIDSAQDRGAADGEGQGVDRKQQLTIVL